MGEDTAVGPIPGRVLVDVMMGMWGGLFCLLVVDLLSRFAGLPIPGSVMLPFLLLGSMCFAAFGALLLLTSRPLAVPELAVAAASFVVAGLLLMDAACCLLCRSYRNAPPLAVVP